MTKNKWLMIGGIIVAVLLIGGGLYWFFKPQSNQKQEATQQVLEENSEVKQVEGTVKVTMKKTEDGKKVTLSIEGIPTKYKNIEYEMSYTTSKDVPRGVLGTITVTSPSYEKDIVLGSCSTNVCTYDDGVNEIKLQLKFNTANGESSVFEKTFSL